MSVASVLTPTQLVQMMLDHSADLDKAHDELRAALHLEAEAERDYRIWKQKCWAKALGLEGPAKMKEDWVNGESAEMRKSRDERVAESKAWLELVRNKRQTLSALQSAANAIKEEAAFSRVGPELEPMMTERHGRH